MTREEQIRLLANIRYDELTTKDALTRIVSALPVSDHAPVAAPTELEAAVGELCSIVESCNQRDWSATEGRVVDAAIARVRAALRNVAGQKGAEK